MGAALAVVAASAVVVSAASGSEATSTRAAFAKLLRTSTAPPEVSVELHDATEEEGLRLEDVSWASLDGERVPAWIVRPVDAPAPLPAIVCLHGSSGSRDSLVTRRYGRGPWTRPGRDEPHTRLLGWARELARRGFLTLSITQRGLDRRTPPINQQANVMLARGRTAMGAILHEIRQGVTHLVGRSDVDPTRIGATGMSFGGITAFYTWLLDDRVAAAAPICGGVGSVELFARTGRVGYHGTYWWVPGIIPAGDHARFAAALAPRPLMLWAPTEDVGMPKPAVDAFARAVSPAWAAAGSPDALAVHQPPGEHAFSPEAFEEMARFFARHLRAGGVRRPAQSDLKDRALDIAARAR